MKQPLKPPVTRCENCDTVAADVVCHICKQPRQAFRALLAPLNAPVGCMYPICGCYGERTPYACEGDPCTWPACECAAPRPSDWSRCAPERRAVLKAA